MIKHHLDQIKSQYDQIKLTFHLPFIAECLDVTTYQRLGWLKYLDEIGNLFFSKPPYLLNKGQFQPRNFENMVRQFQWKATKPSLAHLLCAGTPLDIGEYIVVTTKVRGVTPANFLPKSPELWKVLNQLATKYKIVILGEKEVEMRKEYREISNQIFGLYDQFMSNLTPDRLVDLTVPSLGNTPANVKHMQQDCLIMNQAKAVVTIGIGGNTCMSAACANTIGWRADNDVIADMVFLPIYQDMLVSNNWKIFLDKLWSL